MPRAIWKGDISFGLVNVPVGLYSAEERDTGIQGRLIDPTNMARVREKRVNEETGEEVAWDEVARGFEYEADKYVVLSREEIEAADAEKSRAIDIVGFVKAEEIDPVYYERPYYLEPGERGRKAYAILREALQRADLVGIARFVLRSREYLAALRPMGEGLVLQRLRFAHEVRDMSELDLPGEDLDKLGVSDRELKMAEQLVDAMVMEWHPEEYKDTYRQALLDLIERKVEQGADYVPPKPATPQRGAEVVDIMSLLKESIEAARETEEKPRRAKQGA